MCVCVRVGADGGRRQPRERRGDDVVHALNVKLEDLYKGKTSKLQLTKNVICDACKGKGSQKEGAVKSCDSCHGQGVKVVIRQLGPGMIQQMQVVCPDCKGEGEIIRDKDRCNKCQGEKTVQEKKVLDVIVEKGMSHNQKIFFRGEADQKVPRLGPLCVHVWLCICVLACLFDCVCVALTTLSSVRWCYW